MVHGIASYYTRKCCLLGGCGSCRRVRWDRLAAPSLTQSVYIHVASDGVSVFEQGSSGDWSQPGHWTGDCQATVKEIRSSSASCWYVYRTIQKL